MLSGDGKIGQEPLVSTRKGDEGGQWPICRHLGKRHLSCCRYFVMHSLRTEQINVQNKERGGGGVRSQHLS